MIHQLPYNLLLAFCTKKEDAKIVLSLFLITLFFFTELALLLFLNTIFTFYFLFAVIFAIIGFSYLYTMVIFNVYLKRVLRDVRDSDVQSLYGFLFFALWLLLPGMISTLLGILITLIPGVNRKVGSLLLQSDRAKYLAVKELILFFK